MHWTGQIDGWDDEVLKAEIDDAAADWTYNAPCNFSMSAAEAPDADAWYKAGGVAVLFGQDPEGLLEGGMEVTKTSGGPPDFEANGQTWQTASPAEIVFANSGAWGKDADIESGVCDHTTSLQAILTHDLGHVLGLAHSCDENESCPDPTLQDATMFWTTGECDAHQSVPDLDDADGMSAIYQDMQTVNIKAGCTADAANGLVADCSVHATWGRPTSGTATWNFGDGTTGSGASVTHAYASAGPWRVSVCVPTGECITATTSCLDLDFFALGDGSTDSAVAATPSTCSGCATSPPSPVAAALLLAALGLRRKPR